MRIAYVCADPGVPVFGWKGCSVHVQEVVRALSEAGAHVELFAVRFDGQPPAEMATLCIHRLPAASRQAVSARERERVALRSNCALTAALTRAGPFDLVYERYSLWSYAGMEFARMAGVPGILEVNAPLIEEQAEHRGLEDRVGAERVAERVFAAATALLAVSTEMGRHLEALPCARGRIHVLPNGVDPRRFPRRLRPAGPRAAGTFTLGFVGSLKPWHGLPVLVEAFSRCHRLDSSTRLLVVGDGPERVSLEQDLDRRGLSGATRLTGAVDPTDVPGLLAGMDVAVAPYPDLPGFYFSPLKVYEYMAAARPVVASRVGQMQELIQHEVNGLLCPAGDPASLAATVERMRDDPRLGARLGRAARATVVRRHTWKAVAQRILRLAFREACPA